MRGAQPPSSPPWRVRVKVSGRTGRWRAPSRARIPLTRGLPFHGRGLRKEEKAGEAARRGEGATAGATPRRSARCAAAVSTAAQLPTPHVSRLVGCADRQLGPKRAWSKYTTAKAPWTAIGHRRPHDFRTDKAEREGLEKDMGEFGIESEPTRRLEPSYAPGSPRPAPAGRLSARRGAGRAGRAVVRFSPRRPPCGTGTPALGPRSPNGDLTRTRPAGPGSANGGGP